MESYLQTIEIQCQNDHLLSVMHARINGQDVTQGQILKQVIAGLNSEFSIFLNGCQPKAKEPGSPTIYPQLGGE